MLFLILLISRLLSGVFSEITTGPVNTIAKAGSTVVFPCVTKNNSCTGVDWAKQENIQSSVAIYKSGIGMLNNDKYPQERYNVSSVNGCNLTIHELKLSDSGLYSCSEAKDKHFVLVVVEHEERCQTDATTDISNGTVYNNVCKVKFNPNLIKPWKIELRWSSVSPPRSVNSTEADTVELAYTGIAAPQEVVPQFVCTGSLPLVQGLQESHDKSSPSFQACTLPSLIVHYPVTKITCTDKSGKEKLEFGISETVYCTADGYPPPTCECKSHNTGEPVNCSQFTIPDTRLQGDKYTCTATYTYSAGKTSTATVTLTVTAKEETAPVGLIVGLVLAVIFIIAGGIAGYFLYKKYYRPGKEKGEAVLPLKEGPPKPPRVNSTNSNPGK